MTRLQKHIQTLTNEIVNSVCARWKIHPRLIYSRSQHPRATTARHIIWRELHEAGYNSYLIGKAMKRDPSTIRDRLTRFGKEPKKQTSVDAMIGDGI